MNYLVEMTRDQLRRYKDEELCRVCIEPTIVAIRGQAMRVRLKVHDQLTPGQQGLLAFWVIYGHGEQGWSGFHSQLSGLAREREFWPLMRAGVERLGLRALRESMATFEKRLAAGKASDAALDKELVRLLKPSLEKAADYIRAHTRDFMRLL